MICERCQQNPATIHVTEILTPKPAEDGESAPQVVEEHLCNGCAKLAKLPHQPLTLKKSPAEIWNLLQVSARRARAGAGISCPSCKTTLAEFRQRGRLGCAQCYETFTEQLLELLERIHGAVEHVGRLPGLDDEDLRRLQRVSELERELESAIREEAYENAARIRDELNTLRNA